jgi:hypothetical protein
MEIKATWKMAIRVWWSYLWRNLLMILASFILGAIVGALLCFVLSLLGVGQEVIKVVSMIAGACIGLCASVVPIKLLLGKDFGTFRLILVDKTGN